MKAELQAEEVLAMYDVRGIQKFIFKQPISQLREVRARFTACAACVQLLICFIM